MRLLGLFTALLLLLAYSPSSFSQTAPTDEVTTPTDEVTTPTDEVTTPTDEVTTPTDEVTTPTDEVTTPTDEVTTPTDEVTTPTGEVTTPTDEATTPTNEPTTPSTVTSSPTTPPTPVKVLEQTAAELQKINEDLDKFIALVNGETKTAAAASARRVRRSLGHPAVWWLREGSTRPRADSVNFCEEEAQVGSLCLRLESKITATNDLVLKLNADVDAWKESDLQALQQHRIDLDALYEEAEKEPEKLTDDVNTVEFNDQISEVKATVNEGTKAVEDKIEEMTDATNDSGGSVALVAVLGTLGGLMIVALVGVIGYRFYKHPKTKHPTPDEPYNKLEGETIPIGRLSHEAPAPSQQAPRTNAYSQGPAPPPRREPSYASPYGSKSESSYGGRSESRYASSNTGGGLPRARL